MYLESPRSAQRSKAAPIVNDARSPLERWESVASGARAQNVIVASWVGLESLLCRGASTTEITYRASLRLAALVGQDSTERRALLVAARKTYHARSTILHGADTSRLELD